MKILHKQILGLMGKADIDCHDEDGVIVFDLSGQLDVYNSGDLKDLISAFLRRGFKQFVMNMENLTYMDSSTISVFIQGLQSLEEINGKFFLANLTGGPKDAIEMAKLQTFFNVFSDVSSALQGMQS
jgi:anti-sigma B factor antagonist